MADKEDILDLIDVEKISVKSKRGDIYAKSLLKKAKRDLKTSKLVYGDKDYSGSMDHFQQAVEKTSKAFGLLLGLVSEEELKRKISHKTPYVFILPLEKRLQFLFPLYGRETSELTSAKEEIFNPKKREKLAKMPLKEINSLLDLANKSSVNIQKVLKEYFTNDRLLQNPIITLNLYILSIITFAHANPARYPALDKKLGADNYTKDFPVVVALPRMWGILEEVLLKIESR